MTALPVLALRSAGLLVVAALVCWFAAPSALAQREQPAPGYSGEYIDEFKAVFDIRPNGTLEVQETIKVYAKGRDIQRGIYRAFPNNRREAYQTDYLPIANLRVKRDGEPENIGKTEIDGLYYRTYFGQSDVKLPTNRFYTWELNYTVPKAILQFDESDNFDWNVIGPDWEFPIREWEIAVRYPEGAVILDDKVFTGSYNTTTAVHLKEKQQTDRVTLLRGTGLEKKQGVTYVLRFSPDLIAPQPGYPVINQAYFDALENEEQRQREMAEAARQAAAAALAKLKAEESLELPSALIFLTVSMLLSGVSFMVWARVGKQKTIMPVIMPQFDPPNRVGPAASRYITRMGNVDRIKLLVTGIVSLAVKGAVKIEGRKIERISPKESNLTPAEIGILNDLNLVLTGKSFSMKNRSDNKAKMLRQASKNMVKKLREEYRDSFRSNWPWLLGLLGLVNVAWFVACFQVELWIVILLGFFNVVLTLLSFILLRAGQAVFRVRSIIFGLLAVGMLALTMNWNSTGLSLVNLTVYACFLVSTALVFFIRVNINNYSQAGGEIEAHLRGLEMYIRAAERGSLKDEPDASFDHFSKVYPYAFALGLHTEWANKFANELKAWAGQDGALDGQYGHHWYNDDYASFERSLDRFEDRVHSSANYSSSSSGSGGSSFSGGGGGGGGGGGW